MVISRLFEFDCSPQRAFGTVIVNHTTEGDELICTGANNITNTGGIASLSEVNYQTLPNMAKSMQFKDVLENFAIKA